MYNLVLRNDSLCDDVRRVAARQVNPRVDVDVTKSDASSVGGGLESTESVAGTALFSLGDFGMLRVSKKQRAQGRVGAKLRQCLLLAAAALGLLMMEGDVWSGVFVCAWF